MKAIDRISTDKMDGYMAKLSEKKKVATMDDNDCAVLSTVDGSIVQIKKSDLANALADVMRTVTVDKSGLVSATLFKEIFTSHKDASYDFSDPYLPTGCYGVNKDNSKAGINLPDSSPQYGIMIHLRKFESALGGSPALQIYIPSNASYIQMRLHWIEKWSTLRSIFFS